MRGRWEIIIIWQTLVQVQKRPRFACGHIFRSLSHLGFPSQQQKNLAYPDMGLSTICPDLALYQLSHINKKQWESQHDILCYCKAFSLAHFVSKIPCCGFWGSGPSSHYLVLFCFFLSLSLFYLLFLEQSIKCFPPTSTHYFSTYGGWQIWSEANLWIWWVRPGTPMCWMVWKGLWFVNALLVFCHSD